MAVQEAEATNEGELEEGRAYRLIVTGLYTVLIAANLYLAFDWWRDTDRGRAVMDKCAAQVARIRARAAECEGCARRKAMLRAAVNRMHWEAERIVEGEGSDLEGPE